MSKLAETIQKNLALLSENGKAVKALTSLPAVLQPLVEALQPLNTKNAEEPTRGNVKNVLKCVIDENDALIDAAFQIGGALFLTATHLTVARTLFRRCDVYAKDVTAEDGSDAIFKKEASIASLKAMLTKACIGEKQQVAKRRPAKRLLIQLESDADNDNDDDDINVGASTSSVVTSSRPKKSKKAKKNLQREE